MKKKKDFFNKLFLVASIANLIVLFLFFSYLKSNLTAEKKDVQPDLAVSGEADELDDPFITPASGIDEDILYKPILDGDDPALGDRDAKVTIVEFADFSCQFCAEQEKIIKELKDKYGEKVRLVWKDFPDVGSPSWQASIAARCAFDQGKFWEYHDLLFASGDSFGSDSFLKLARRINLNISDFEKCLDDETFADKVKNNIQEAGALRLAGVPFYFVNQEEILGSVSKEDLEKIIREELYGREN